MQVVGEGVGVHTWAAPATGQGGVGDEPVGVRGVAVGVHSPPVNGSMQPGGEAVQVGEEGSVTVALGPGVQVTGTAPGISEVQGVSVRPGGVSDSSGGVPEPSGGVPEPSGGVPG
jgi:hypothetical protein